MRKGHAFKAQDTYNDAFEAARRNGWAEQAAQAALGYEEAVHQPGAPGGPAVRMVSEAIGLIGDDTRPAARAPAGFAEPQPVPRRRPGGRGRGGRCGVVDGPGDRRPG